LNSKANLQPDTMLVNRYLIQDVIGIGGMGAVYRARDMHFPNALKLVAVKEMVNQGGDEEARQSIIDNFEREANILVTLSHPSIPNIFDYFTFDNRSYLVLEYILGKDLEELIVKSKDFFPEPLVMSWAIQLCDVLGYLHSHKPQPIVFRDMKPSNVMINQYNQVVLIDFGIAKIFRAGIKGTMVGTEGYAPPEQYRGEDSPLADIYALGATLHHVLTRRDPRLEPPFTFHERPIRQSNPAVSEKFEAIINKALSYNPEDRYQTALEMKNALIEVSRSLGYQTGVPASYPGVDIHIQQKQGEDGRRVWVFRTGDEIRGSAACRDKAVYVGSYDRKIYSIDIAEGTENWVFSCGGGIVSRPAFYQDNVIFGSEDGSIYALSCQGGKLVWKYLTSRPIRCSPTVAEGIVFIGSDDGYLYAIDALRGELIFQFDAAAAVRSTPCFYNNYVFIANEVGDVICVTLQGSARWHFRAKRGILSSPVLDETGVLYISSLDSFIYALEALTGWVMWRYRMGKGSVSTPALSKGSLYVGSADSIIYCIDTKTSQDVWKFRTENQVSGSPIVFNEFVYCGSADGKLYCLNKNNGGFVWSAATNGSITGTPCIHNNRIYIGSMDHNLYAFQL